MNVEIDIDLKFITITRLWYGLHHALPRHPFLWYPLGVKKNGGKPVVEDETVVEEPLHVRRSARRRSITSPRGVAARITGLPIKSEPVLWQEAILYLMLTVVGLVGFLVWASLDFPMEIIVLITGMVTGGFVAVGISNLISRERERGRYDLMGLSPSGLLGASWVMSTRFLRFSETFDNMRQLVNTGHTVWMIILVPLLLINFLVVARAPERIPSVMSDFGTDLSPFANALILLVVSRADFMYSVVIGAMTGMIVPTLTRGRSESYVYSLVLFVLQQLVVYIALIVVSALVWGILWALFGSVAGYTLSIVWMGVFFALREVEIRALCAVLAWRVNVNRAEVMTISQNSI